MDVPSILREARSRADLTQAALAERAGTSQATVSAYESGTKHPSVQTLERLLNAAGAGLVVEHGRPELVAPSASRHAHTGRALLEVLALAEALPTRHEPRLRFPRLQPR